MSNKDNIFKRKWFGVFTEGKKLGVCIHCKDYVYDDQLYVEKDDKLSHYSCHNYKEANEKDE